MLVEVRLYATLRKYAPNVVAGAFVIEVPSETKVADIIKIIGVPVEEVHLVMKNGINAAVEQVVREGDRVGLFPAVGGG